jgi:hypothetical protein
LGEQIGVSFTKKRIPREKKKKMQEKVDQLEIIKGFPKVVWQYCTFSLEVYRKKKEKLKIESDRSENFIPRLLLEEHGTKFRGLYGAYYPYGSQEDTCKHYELIRDHCSKYDREAIIENDDLIKYKEIKIGERTEKEVEWIFSHRIGWDRIPEEIIRQIEECNYMEEYFSKTIEDENYADPEIGRRNSSS